MAEPSKKAKPAKVSYVWEKPRAGTRSGCTDVSAKVAGTQVESNMGASSTMSLVQVTAAQEGLKDCARNLLGSREPCLLWRAFFFFLVQSGLWLEAV